MKRRIAFLIMALGSVCLTAFAKADRGRISFVAKPLKIFVVDGKPAYARVHR
jgi:hypothetical protein